MCTGGDSKREWLLRHASGPVRQSRGRGFPQHGSTPPSCVSTNGHRANPQNGGESFNHHHHTCCIMNRPAS